MTSTSTSTSTSIPTSDPAPNAVDVQDAFCLHPLADGGAVAALRGLSLVVPAGERLVVHGPNGSGKTTLLRALVGEQRLAAGRAVVAGLDLATAGRRQLAAWRSSALGQIDQDAWRLLRPEFDVLANVSLQLRIGGASRSVARAQGLACLDRLGLADLAGRRLGTLSGGQRQRVAVCAAVAHGPRLVLADEPTGELDLASADAVYALLDAAVAEAGATLVLVSHDHRAAAVADRVVRIRDGRISETWRPAGRSGTGSADSAGPVEPVREALVVDSRGWIRLPAPLRPGLGSQLTVEAADGGVLLRPESGGQPPEPGDTEPAESDGALQLAGGVLPLERLEPIRTDSIGTDPIAELAGVVVAYDGRVVIGSAGAGLDLSVRRGQLTVVAGRSGAGKSTLLRILLGLQRPDAGRVRLNGADLTDLSRAELARARAGGSAVVLQQIHLAGTADASANLDLARAARGLAPDRAAGAALLARLGLSGLTGVDGRPVSGLSGGERQRLAVARAIAVRPALLVLDEPTSQLDEASAELMASTLLALTRSGPAVLVATHDPVLIAAADCLLELS